MTSDASVRSLVSEAEWDLRVNLAACYRLVAHFGWDDLIFTHLSVRVPGPEHHFLINPYNLMFEEITASSLVKIDVETKILVRVLICINTFRIAFVCQFFVFLLLSFTSIYKLLLLLWLCLFSGLRIIDS